MGHITLTVELDRDQAQAYLRWLASHYDQALNSIWRADRHTPEGLTGHRVFAEYPHLVGVTRTLGQLKQQLEARA